MSDSASTSSNSVPPSSSYESYDCPDPPFRYDPFDLGKLPKPPEGFRLGSKTPRVAVRDLLLKKKMVDEMLEYHFWGIDPGVVTRLTVLAKVKLLYKLVYHQDPEHRPKHMGEMVDAKMDAGPRLLSRSIHDPLPLPVSRYFPDMPSDTTPLRDDYVRPTDAEEDVPDTWLQQQMYPSRKQAFEQGDESDDSDGRVVPDRRAKRVAKRRAAKDAHPVHDDIPNYKVSDDVRYPNYAIKDVVDAVEKAVFRFAYFDLDRHPTAAPLTPRPHIHATSVGDLLKAVVGSFPAIAYVNMSFDSMADAWIFGSGKKPYVYRGRGPVERENSSAVDCAIVVGRLLDAGSTVIDRKQPDWPKHFTNAEKAFIEATDLNWDVCSPEISADQRDQLWMTLENAERLIGMGNINPLWNVWSACTGNFAQFQFEYAESVANCPCTAHGVTTEERFSSFVSASLNHSKAHGATMQDLVARYFAPTIHEDCDVCWEEESVLRGKRFASLPLRMVVLCDNERVKNHTNDLTFTYADMDGHEKTAKYRWLGGVYYKNSRYRVVWTDGERGEYDSGAIRFYDGATNSGLIVGGVPPTHQNDRVPGGWMGEGIIPMLVYERVMDPDPSVLTVAKKSVEDMMGAQMQGQLILDAHAPWTRPRYPRGILTQPWLRVLPERGQRFHTARVAPFPGEPSNRSPVTSTFSEVIKRNQPTSQQARGYMDPALPQMPTSSPLSKVNRALSATRLRSRTPMSMLNSSAMASRRSSMMQVDSETQTNDPSSSPPASLAAWVKHACGPGGHRRPSAGEESAEQHDTGRKKKTVRFGGAKSRSKLTKATNGARAATRKSSRLSRVKEP